MLRLCDCDCGIGLKAAHQHRRFALVDIVGRSGGNTFWVLEHDARLNSTATVISLFEDIKPVINWKALYYGP